MSTVSATVRPEQVEKPRSHMAEREGRTDRASPKGPRGEPSVHICYLSLALPRPGVPITTAGCCQDRRRHGHKVLA